MEARKQTDTMRGIIITEGKIMSVNGVSSSSYDYQSSVGAYENKKVTDSAEQKKEKDAVVYEKSQEGKPKKAAYKQDTKTIERLKAEAEQRTQSLRNLVEQMLTKQGKTLLDSDNMYQMLREGKLDVPEDVRLQAQKDIAEDGYWGVKQTAERMVSFAKALTGGDPEQADKMIEAVRKGFDQATKAWGDKLPDICQKTIDTAIKQLEDWKDGKEE